MGVGTAGGHLDRPDHGIAARASSAEFAQAVGACNFAVLVWQLPDGVVTIANDAASRLLATSLPDLLGAKNVDLLGPRDDVETSFASLSSRAVEYVRARRHLLASDGLIPVWVWSRLVEMDDALSAVSVLVPVTELGRLDRDPSAPWRDLGPVAVGTADLEWRIKAVSADLGDIIGAAASDVIGSSFLDLVHPDDASLLFAGQDEEHNVPRSHCLVRLRHREGWWVDVCVLVSSGAEHPLGSVTFALLGVPKSPSLAPVDRVKELELRLRHIAAEVRASGVLDQVDAMPATSDQPQLSELTGRQWEVLSRIIRGEPVSTIASELFISQSTVRNHLANIYAKFAVHSQAQLLGALHDAPLSRPADLLPT